MENPKTKLVEEGNTIYEIDLECIKKKENREKRSEKGEKNKSGCRKKAAALLFVFELPAESVIAASAKKQQNDNNTAAVSMSVISVTAGSVSAEAQKQQNPDNTVAVSSEKSP